MKETKLTFIADLHYYSETLGTDGRAYALRSGSDQKCLGETGGIIDAAFSAIAAGDSEAVLILGDVSNDGERICHEELREKLYELKKHKPVYLLTATHDWCCDQNPRRFVGNSVYHDVPVMAGGELRDFYEDFGPKEALSEFFTHLGTSSYTADIGENVRILCLNDDQNGKGRAGFKEDHFCWIEEQIKKAKEEGKFLIGMEHHLLMNHVHPILTAGTTCVGDKEEVASRLADAGLRYMFVGHSHLQSIECFTSKKGNPLFEINVGSLCGYPSPMVNVTVSEEGVKIRTDHPGKFTYQGKTYDTLDYVRQHSLGLVDNILAAAISGKTDFTERLTALGVPEDKASLLYIIARPIVKYVRGVTVGEGYKKLKLLGFGRFFNKALMEEFRDKKAMDFAYEIFLSALDGGKVRHEKGSSYYRAVMDFMAIPVKIKDCTFTRSLGECVSHILTGSRYDINGCILPNLYQ